MIEIELYAKKNSQKNCIGNNLKDLDYRKKQSFLSKSFDKKECMECYYSVYRRISAFFSLIE